MSLTSSTSGRRENRLETLDEDDFQVGMDIEWGDSDHEQAIQTEPVVEVLPGILNGERKDVITLISGEYALGSFSFILMFLSALVEKNVIRVSFVVWASHLMIWLMFKWASEHSRNRARAD